MRFNILNLTLAFFSVTISAQRLRDNSGPFQLYGYGDDCYGMPLYYADGFAYLGDPSLAGSAEAAVVNFSSSGSRIFTGNPNTTSSSSTPSWANVTFFVPALAADDKRVGFLPSNSTGTNGTVTSNGFGFFGSTMMLSSGDGGVQTMFYGQKLQNGVFGLYWNDMDGKIPITLRRIAPSKPETRR